MSNQEDVDEEAIWRQAMLAKAEDQPSDSAWSYYTQADLCSACKEPKCTGGDGIPVCSQCGLVDPVYIDVHAEWNLYPGNDTPYATNPERCGPSMDTELFSEKWGTGSAVYPKGFAPYTQKRMAKINLHMSMNHKDRSLYLAYKDIERAAHNLELKEYIIRDAKVLYRYFSSERLSRGAKRAGIKANCLLFSCKQNGVSRTIHEIASAFEISSRDISRTASAFHAVVTKRNNTGVGVPTSPADVVMRQLNDFCSEEGDKRMARVKCLRYAKMIEPCTELMGKAPSSVAAVVILKVLGSVYSKQEIARKCDVSVPTINKIESIVTTYMLSKKTQ